MKSKLIMLFVTVCSFVSFPRAQAGSYASEADRTTRAKDLARTLPKGVLVRIDAKGNRVVIPTDKVLKEGTDLAAVAKNAEKGTKLSVQDAPRVTEFDKARPKQAWYSYYSNSSYSFQSSYYWYYGSGYSYAYRPYWQSSWNNYNWQYYTYHQPYQGCGYWWYPNSCYGNGWGNCW